ncbi:hypothetical protein IQ216_05510 [Cyanobium sp. LEGE 06143]|uniref:hypothetical protein n=1 Tax=Cyanobium sp. LEGE 06143 TaxID=945727 RepID=UPI00187F607D|nr:hypothetical protein [Cyanobium sp. LEGE 06143]MBE9172561.1 hypothetical protein [Cyanobium sp. LEGE 06143]
MPQDLEYTHMPETNWKQYLQPAATLLVAISLGAIAVDQIMTSSRRESCAKAAEQGFKKVSKGIRFNDSTGKWESHDPVTGEFRTIPTQEEFEERQKEWKDSTYEERKEKRLKRSISDSGQQRQQSRGATTRTGFVAYCRAYLSPEVKATESGQSAVRLPDSIDVNINSFPENSRQGGLPVYVENMQFRLP